MKKETVVSVVFGLSALYDGLLGIFFLFAAPAVFRWYEVTPPNHYGYVHFPAALLIIFGLMFLAIARNPVRNRNLIPYGILLKIAYCTVSSYHWFTAGIPGMWKPFTIIDLVFLVLFIWAFVAVREERATA
jgi:hypothetical protein